MRGIFIREAVCDAVTMSLRTLDPLASLWPVAVAWAEEQAQLIGAQGRSLDAAQLADARAIGVTHPERVRILAVREIPAPDDPFLAAAAERAGLIFPTASGLTLGYGIYLRADRQGDRQLVAHELVHTRQCERFGGMAAFLQQYLVECLTVGYAGAPLELEAIAIAAEICRA